MQKLICFILNLYDLGRLENEILTEEEIEIISDQLLDQKGILSLKYFDREKFENILDFQELTPTISFVVFNLLIIEKVYPDQVQIEFNFLVS